MRILYIIGVCLWLLYPVLGTTGTETVATVGRLAISQRDLTEKVNVTINRTYFHNRLPQGKESEIRQQALDSLIEEALLFLEAERQGVKIEKEKVDNQLAAVEKRFGSKKSFKEALERVGYTVKAFREKLRRDLMAREIYSQEVTARVKVTTEQLQAYYEANRQKFKKPETVNLQHILVKVKNPVLEDSWEEARKRALELRGKIEAGEDFADVASKYSEGMYRIKGGRMGEIHRGRLPKEIEAAAFSLVPGTVGQPVKSTFGYSIVKVLEKKESRQLSFEEIKESLRKTLEDKKTKELKTDWLTALRKRFEVKVLIDSQ